MEAKFDFDDIMLPPAAVSNIESRKTINININGMLPLFTAPMDTVVNETNYKIFIAQGVKVVLPRTVNNKPYEDNSYELWFSYGLSEFKDKFLSDYIDIKMKKHKLDKIYALIDIANGNMQKLIDLVIDVKKKYGNKLILMVGNVANSKTFEILSNAGADYIRCGIGGGAACLTSEQSSINYPLGSLIKETYEISCTLKNPAKIVADGGFKKYSDIIKALALGADHIMVGSIMNKSLESCANTYKANIKHDGWTEPGAKVDQYSEKIKESFQNGTRYFKKFRGMSTKEVQKLLGNTEIKTSEGITKMNLVEYTIEGWCENFKHYLSSAMSYTNNDKLENFIGETEFIFITNNALNRFKK